MECRAQVSFGLYGTTALTNIAKFDPLFFRSQSVFAPRFLTTYIAKRCKYSASTWRKKEPAGFRSPPLRFSISFSVYAIPQISGSSQLLQDFVWFVIFCLSTSINYRCMSRWDQKHISVLSLPFKQESGGLLLLDEDRKRSVNTWTTTWCWTALWMFKSLRWMCLCSSNQCFGCGDWSNHSEGFRHAPSMNFTSLGCVSWFSQVLLAILFQSFSTFLNSLNSFWRGHPIWLQLHDHHDRAPNSDTVPRSNSYRAYNEAPMSKTSKPTFKSV